MKPNRPRWSVALAAALGCGLLLGSPVASLASAAPTHTAAKPVAHPAGFFVSGIGESVAGTAQSSLVHDDLGGNHVVTTKRQLSASGDRGHVIYATRRWDAKTWTRTSLPGLRPLAGIRLQELLTADGSNVIVMIYQCDGVYVTETTLNDTQLPTPTLVQAENNCASPAGAPIASAPPIAKAVAVPDFYVYDGTTYVDNPDAIGVLLDDPAQGNQPAIFFGGPTGPFTAGPALPTANAFVPLQLTYDNQTDVVVAVGRGTAGTNEAIYETALDLSNVPRVWSTPAKVASLASPTRDYTLESVAADQGTVWIGLLKPHTSTGSPTAATLYLAHSASSGQWFAPTPMPHTTGHDTALQLIFNTNTGALHVAFTRVNLAAPVKKSGIMTETLENYLDATWPTPKFLTHWAHDYTQQLTLTGTGHAVIGYNQR